MRVVFFASIVGDVIVGLISGMIGSNNVKANQDKNKQLFKYALIAGSITFITLVVYFFYLAGKNWK